MTLTACSNVDKEVVSRNWEGTNTLVTSAKARTLQRIPYKPGKDGRLLPEYVTCAEPSPDVAEAVSTSFSTSLAADIKGLKGVDAKAAASLAFARAEAVAQLTERLATIQLLRDGLYRACEAYANGAITDTTYAVLLSRYDDTMVTLLMGELAAGNFGRSLAVLGSAAAARGEAGVSEEIEARVEAVTDAQQTATQKSDEERAQQKTTEAAKVDAAKNPTDSGKQAEAAKQEAALKEKEKESNEAQENLKSELEALSVAFAVAGGIGVGSIDKSKAGDAETAKTLLEMQERYLHNLNFDAVSSACLHELAKQPASPELMKAAIEASWSHRLYREAVERLEAAKNASEEAKARNASVDAEHSGLMQKVAQQAGQLQAAVANLKSAAHDQQGSLLAAHCAGSVLERTVEAQGALWELLLERGNIEKEVAAKFDSSEAWFEFINEAFGHAGMVLKSLPEKVESDDVKGPAKTTD